MDEYRAKGDAGNAEDLDGGHQGTGDDPNSGTLPGYTQSKDDIHVIDVKFVERMT